MRHGAGVGDARRNMSHVNLCAQTSPPLMAIVLAPSASWLACMALSAFCLTVELNCSIEAAVFSRAEACSLVR